MICYSCNVTDIADLNGRVIGTIWPVTSTTIPCRNTSEFMRLRMTLIYGQPAFPNAQCRVQWWVQYSVASWVKRLRIFDTATVSGTRTADGPVPSLSVITNLSYSFINLLN